MSNKIVDLEKRIKNAYADFYKSVTIGKEHDVRGRFIQHVILHGLGYPENCYLNEKEKSKFQNKIA